jgi:catechol 2,3-dioxygenase-like lactoylglutathione lyase family enzyme
MLGSIAHVALVVRDTARTAELFKSLFDCKEVSRRDAEGHDEKFVKLGDTWFALVQADMQRSRTGDHIAFKVSKETLEITAQKLQGVNIERRAAPLLSVSARSGRRHASAALCRQDHPSAQAREPSCR